MTWHKGTPAISGWYWTYIVDGRWHSEPEVCYVDIPPQGPDDPHHRPVIYCTHKPKEPTPKMFDARFFCGPLPVPALTHGLPLFEGEDVC